MIPSLFYITHTASVTFSSPIVWLIWLLLTGIFVMVDIAIVIFQKEVFTDLHTMFKSIERQKGGVDSNEDYIKAIKWYKENEKNKFNWYWKKKEDKKEKSNVEFNY